jgi:hypothetical protein
MALTRRSELPMQISWGLIGGIFLAFAFIIALTLIVLWSFKRPTPYYEQQYRPAPAEPQRPSHPGFQFGPE